MMPQQPTPWWDRLPDRVGASDAVMLRGVREAVKDAFPHRLDALILLDPPTPQERGQRQEWHLVALLADFDAERDSQRLCQVMNVAAKKGISVTLGGLPANRKHIEPALLHRIDCEGIPVSNPDAGMTCAEHHLWQRDEPDLHELIDGQPLSLAPEKQATRRFFRVLVAAIAAHDGDWDAGRAWMERYEPELGMTPWNAAADGGWSGVGRSLRLLEASAPGCTEYHPRTAAIRIDFRPKDLLAEAERLATIEASRQ